MSLDPVKLSEMAKAYAVAWSSKSPEAVAAFYAEDGRFCANLGETVRGRAAIEGMAAGFFADLPDLVVHCDDARAAGNHALFLWTLEGHSRRTNNRVRVSGWEEWDLDSDLRIVSSFGWFDTEDYERQMGA